MLLLGFLPFVKPHSLPIPLIETLYQGRSPQRTPYSQPAKAYSMVQSIASITPFAVPPVSPVQSTTAASNAATIADQVNFLTAFEQLTALQNITAGNDNTTGNALTSDDSILGNAVLTNLSPQALNVLSGIENNVGVAENANGNLTPLQVEEIATLQQDAELLNITDSITFSPLDEINTFGGASTVSLSPQALDILNGLDTGTAISTGISVATNLTAAQQAEVSAIVAPFISQPLTPTTITQIQTALATAGFNPTQISLEDIFLTMSYAVGELPSPPDAEQAALNDTIMAEELDYA
jgi:hypothetical protein